MFELLGLVPSERLPSGAPSSPFRIRVPTVVAGNDKPGFRDEACNA